MMPTVEVSVPPHLVSSMENEKFLLFVNRQEALL